MSRDTSPRSGFPYGPGIDHDSQVRAGWLLRDHRLVFLERSNGWVDAVWYDDQAEAEEAWADVEEERAMT